MTPKRIVELMGLEKPDYRIAGFISKELKKLEEEKGSDFCDQVKALLMQEWGQFKALSGVSPYPVWRAMFSRAKNEVEQKYGQNFLSTIARTFIDKSKPKPSENTANGHGGRTSGLGSNVRFPRSY